jgi:tetratricopeptide (TPR) repeat protein
MKNVLFVIFICIGFRGFAQPNCEAYKYYGEELKYKACKQAMKIRGHYQFSKAYQIALDKSIEIDSTFAYAYWAKSIAYLKSGDFITWKTLIDKAVEYDPKEYLGYRGWCRYQFFRDYKGAIEDIEKLDSIVDYDIAYSQNGIYHLNVAKGLCYKAIGEPEKAIRIIKNQIIRNEEEQFVGPYDYLHLGVLYLETNKLEEALDMFKKQSLENELAESHYYSALVFLKLNKQAEYKSSLEKAKQLYLEEKRMSDPYSNPMDKIYLETIETKLKKIIK